MKPDFSLLYSELHLPPDCSLEEFKRAYRRRIAELHPDRKQGGPPLSEAQAALPALIATYVAVNRFHRRYGRMPGASPRSGAGTGQHPAQPTARSGFPIPVPGDDGTERPARATWRLVIAFIALLALLASWDWLTFRP